VADDIVTRLRQHALMCDHGFPNGGGPMGPDPTECASCRRSQQAADLIEAQQAEIERLQKENARLSAFLFPIGALINSQPTPIPTEGISGITEEEVKEFLKEFGRD